MPPEPRGRAWCLTVYTDKDEFDFESEPQVRFAIWQREVGDAKHHEHVQMYLELKTTQRASWVKARFPNRPHVEPRRGTQEEAIKYVTKLKGRIRGPWEYGTKAKQGQRTDLMAVAATIRASTSLARVVEEHPVEFIRMSRGMETYFDYTHRPPRRGKPDVIILWGESGTGKSRAVFDQLEEEETEYYLAPDCSPVQWMDGYRGEETIVFDDFEAKMPVQQFKNLIDWHPLRMQRKHGWVIINAKYFIFTSNLDPRDWYQGDPNVRRRLKDFAAIAKYSFEENNVRVTQEWDSDNPEGSTWP